MQPRIRSIKPEFFRHFDLYEAERQSKLPLRVAFAGLWCCADREGRFEWRPHELKVLVLPHDKVDFARVLDALTTRGFVVRYEAEGRTYGLIPSFKRHQVINNRESASTLPVPITSTRAPRVEDACPTRHDLDQGEGNGREGNGREGNISSACADDVGPSLTDRTGNEKPSASAVIERWNAVAEANHVPKVRGGKGIDGKIRVLVDEEPNLDTLEAAFRLFAEQPFIRQKGYSLGNFIPNRAKYLPLAQVGPRERWQATPCADCGEPAEPGGALCPRHAALARGA